MTFQRPVMSKILKSLSKDDIKKVIGSEKMIAYIAGRISSFFVEKKLIKEEDKELYDYSFEICLASVLNFMIVLVLAIITKTLLYSIVFLLGFMPMRLAAGGYHAGNHLRCMLLLVGVFLAFVVLIYKYPIFWMNTTIFPALLFNTVCIFLLAPLEDKNHPLEERQRERLKVKSQVLALLYAVITGIGIFTFHDTKYVFSFVLGYLAVALSLVASKVKSWLDIK